MLVAKDKQVNILAHPTRTVGPGMTSTPIIERIDPGLEDLMERFFVGSNQDLVKMRATLDRGDFVALARLGHTAKGTGFGYGFKGMGEIGRDLETAAREQDRSACAEQVQRMEHYLANVEVRFGE